MTSEPLTVFITKKVLHLLLSARKEEATRDSATGRFRLSYCLPYQVTAILCGVFFALFLALGIVLRDEPRSWAIYSSIFGVALLATLYWNFQVFLVEVTFSEEGIHREGGLGGAVKLPWSSVNRVDFSEASSAFTFRGVDGQRIGVSVYQNGLGTFADFASRGLAGGPAAQALPLLRQKALNS